MSEPAIPHLTKSRWAYLRALKGSIALRTRPFLAKELRTVKGDFRQQFTATGATMSSLCDAGWIEKVRVEIGGRGAPFRVGSVAQTYRVTDAGLAAIDACPDTFPGQPVYEKATP